MPKCAKYLNGEIIEKCEYAKVLEEKEQYEYDGKVRECVVPNVYCYGFNYDHPHYKGLISPRTDELVVPDEKCAKCTKKTSGLKGYINSIFKVKK